MRSAPPPEDRRARPEHLRRSNASPAWPRRSVSTSSGTSSTSRKNAVAKAVPVAGGSETFERRHHRGIDQMRPGRFVEDEPAHQLGHRERGAERHVRAVGVADHEGRRTDAAEQRRGVVDLVLERVSGGRIARAAPAAGHRVDGEALREKRLHVGPVRPVIAEGAVDEEERRTLAIDVVADAGTRRAAGS